VGIDADTLERLVPDRLDPEDLAGSQTLALHVERYAFAAEHARAGRLLDLACGVGYGTRLVADRRGDISEALGVDLAEGAVAHARECYAGGRVDYRSGDGMAFEDEHGFDTVVSLETVEHVPDPRALLGRLVSLLRPGGVLVSSVPTTPSVDLNPHHLHDFTAASFRAMGAAYGLEEIAALEQVQTLDVLDVFRGDKRFKRENLRPGLPAYYCRHPAALVRRIGSTLRFGFANHYLTLAWQRGGPSSLRAGTTGRRAGGDARA